MRFLTTLQYLFTFIKTFFSYLILTSYTSFASSYSILMEVSKPICFNSKYIVHPGPSYRIYSIYRQMNELNDPLVISDSNKGRRDGNYLLYFIAEC